MKKVLLLIILGLVALGVGAGIRYYVEQQKIAQVTEGEAVKQEIGEDKLVFEPPEVVVPGQEAIKISPHVIYEEESTGYDIGSVIYKGMGIAPSSLLPFIHSAFAQTSQLTPHRVVVYLAQDPSSPNQNQLFLHDLENGTTLQLTQETEAIYESGKGGSGGVKILDYPASAVAYYTATGFKIVLLENLSVVRLSGISRGAFNYFAVSPDGRRLAHFDEESQLVVRDLTDSNLRVISTHPNPLAGSPKGSGDVAPFVFSADVSSIYTLLYIDTGTGEARNSIIEFRLGDNSVHEIVPPDSQKSSIYLSPDEQSLLYTERRPVVIGEQFHAFNLKKVDLTTKAQTFLTSINVRAYLFSSDGSKIYYAEAITSALTTFKISGRDVNTGQQVFGDEVTTEAGIGSLVGFGIDENYLIFRVSRSKEGAVETFSGGTVTYYSYSMASKTLQKLFDSIYVFDKRLIAAAASKYKVPDVEIGGPGWLRVGESFTWVVKAHYSEATYTYEVNWDDGTSESQVASEATFTHSYTSSGIYTPSFKVSGSQGLLKEVGVGSIDVSDELPAIRVTSPNGGEVWQAGGIYNITWISQNIPSEAQNKVQIILAREGGGDAPSIRLTNLADDGVESITIPSDIPSGKGAYRISITCPGSATFSGCRADLSDFPFFIQ